MKNPHKKLKLTGHEKRCIRNYTPSNPHMHPEDCLINYLHEEFQRAKKEVEFFDTLRRKICLGK